jgi:peptidyl-prolyl cis-trans isomerase C
MIRRNLISLLCIWTLLGLAANARQEKTTSPDAAPSPESAGSDLVVARVSGEPITEKQVLSAIDQLARQRRVPPDKMQERNTLLFKTALDGLVTTAVLKGEARQQKLTADPAKVDQQMQQVSKNFPSQEEFQKAMAQQGVTESQLRRSIEENLVIQQLWDQATGHVPDPTEEEIAKYYEGNADKFAFPEQVRAAHILLRTDPKSTPEQKEEIKKKLEGIRAEIESKAITFADAAAKYSEDPSNAKKGGDLGFFSRGSMVKPFEEAAFTTKPGTLSPVIETQFGYHIIQVAELRPARKLSLEEAKPPIKQILNQMAKQTAAQKYVAELKAKAQIETFMTAEEFGKRHPSK